MDAWVMAMLDFTDRDEPTPSTDWRQLLTAWLDYQRHQFKRKLRDVSSEGLVAWSVPPLELSIVGLVRHMTQMEHVYLSWGLGGGDQNLIYGDEDYSGGSLDTIDADVRRYLAEVDKADEAITDLATLESPGHGHGWPLGATLIKMIDEYALHSGQAHMLRYAALGEVVR
jgi:hypothetical protein